jgi:predicted DNA-binding transcriptional regulator YafY
MLMSQRQQLERILEIDRRVRAGLHPNARQLAQALEVTSRVIYKDREFMVDRLGAPIVFDRDRGGWVYSDRTWVLPTSIVTEGELLAFFLGVELAQRYLGTSFGEALASAIAKVARSLKGPVVVDLEALRAHYTFAPPAAAAVKPETLLALHQAIAERRSVKMTYFTASRRKHTERMVDPYHLFNAKGEWYLIGRDRLHRGVRQFHVGRIESWQVLDRRFLRDPQFSIEAWLRSAFQMQAGARATTVRIRFDENQAPYIRERRWHDTQKIEDLPDGGLILQFTTAALDEVKRWVLQYGEHAEVLEPEELREMVKRAVTRMGEVYRRVADES